MRIPEYPSQYKRGTNGANWLNFWIKFGVVCMETSLSHIVEAWNIWHVIGIKNHIFCLF